MQSTVKIHQKHFRIFKQIRRSTWLYFIFAFPFAYYVIFQYVPLYGVLLAFKDFNVMKGIVGSPWVGFKHFEKFITDPYFWKLIRNTVLISFYGLLWGFPVPIILAILLNEVKHQKFKKVIQNISYLPHFISTVVVCGMVVNILSTGGPVDMIVKFLGGRPEHWLTEARYFRTIYIASGIWQGAGWTSIIYLAALSMVDEEQYDAALIDGANRWQRIWYITLPGILPTVSVMLLLNLGGFMSVGYEKVLLLYTGRTYETADIISTYVYRRGILGSDFSYTTAVGLFQSVVTLILIVVSNSVSRKISEVSLW
jgi:putative aldouronate transport system permease protein